MKVHPNTKREKAEEELIKSEERFRGIAERSFDTIYMIDREGCLTYVSPAVEKSTGYSPGELVGRRFLDFLPKSYIMQSKNVIKRLRAGKPVDVTLAEVIRKNGSRAQVEFNIFPIVKAGEFLGAQGTIRDITDHKHIQETIRKNEEMFRRTFEAIPDPAYLWARQVDGKIILHQANRAAARITRDRIWKYLGMPLETLHGKQPELIARIRRVFETGRSLNEEVLYTYLSIRKKKWLLVDFVLAAENSVLVITKDITQRKKNEEKLLRYQEQLRSLTLELILTEERERRKIAVNLHDHVGQQLALAKMKLETLHSGKAHFGQDREVKEIGRILADTIRGTRSLIFELSPPILYELGFEAAVEWLAESIHEQFHFQIDVESDNRGEPLNEEMQVMLFQIIRELLLNIAKHSQARRAKIGIRRGHRHIRILVEDNGIGFDGDKYFSRKNSSGFGFFSIRERLHSLGGDLRVESEVGKGTSVFLRVPLRYGAGIKREKNNGN